MMTVIVDFKRTGYNIKNKRRTKKVKIFEMSEETGISIRRLMMIENCCKRIKLVEITSICNYLNIKLEDILIYNVV